MSKKNAQSILSFHEQKHAISICKKTMDAYAISSNIFTKSLCIHGFPGAGMLVIPRKPIISTGLFLFTICLILFSNFGIYLF